MEWSVYLSGEIHSDWRERIRAGVAALGLPVRLTAPVTDHEASDECGVRTFGELPRRLPDLFKGSQLVVLGRYRSGGKATVKLSGSGPYWFGDRVTLTDLAFYPFFERLPALAYWRGLSIPDDCPRLKAWLAAMQGRESVRKIAHDGAFFIKHYTARAGEVIAA